MSWLEDQIAAVTRAERAFEDAEEAWHEAASAYRVAFYAATRHVVDEWGCRTGETEPFTPAEVQELEELLGAELSAWSRRQRAQERLESAERVLNGGLP